METLPRPITTTTTSAPAPGRWRRRLAVAIVVLATAGIVVAVAAGGGEHGMMMPGDTLPADVRGVYGLEDGRELTLYGTETRAIIEIDRAISFLASSGPDAFASDDGTTLTLVQDRDGAVAGLKLGLDGTTTTATRTEPYTEHEVTFDSGDVTLVGSLLVPSTAGPHPGVVIVHGAEWATRETYRLLATHYARRGVAVLIYDKRGTGHSSGDVASASFDDLTADALAGHTLLRQQTHVDPDRVGIAGFSQGGWVAALAARATDDVAFVVAYSASGFSPGDQHAWLYGSMLNVRGMSARTIEAAERFQATLYSTVDVVESGYVAPFPHVPGFWFHALDHRQETAGLWRDVHQPVLGVWGADDCQVPAHDSADALRDALERGGNPRYTLQVLSGADHSLYLAGPCVHELGIHADQMVLAPGYLDAAADWIARLDTDRPDREFELAPTATETPLGWHHQPPTPPSWYGHATTQTVTLFGMLLAFGAITAEALVRAARRRPPSGDGRLIAATATTGLAAVLTGFGALAELAGLGGTHVAQIVGSGPIAGMPPLLLAAGVLVTATAGLGIALAVNRVRTSAAELAPAHRRPVAGWVTVATTVVLAAWATYWQMPWFPGGLL